MMAITQGEHNISEGLARTPLGAVLDRVDEVRESGEVETFPLTELGDRIVDVALVPIRDRAGASLRDAKNRKIDSSRPDASPSVSFASSSSTARCQSGALRSSGR